MRIAHNELVYTAAEFANLSVAAVCRHYGWDRLGDSWIDREHDEQAAAELDRFDPARC